MSENEGSDRLDEFQEEVDRLRVSGGLANPERSASTIGIVLLAVGGFFALVWSFTKRGDTAGAADDGRTQELLIEIVHANNNVWIALFGIALILLGMALWLRNSITRYLRYWLIRIIYEERAATDRLVEALERNRGD